MYEDNAPRIYVEKQGQLSAFDDKRFDSEDEIQALIAAHPELLSGEQIDTEAPPRWLLVAREMAVPDSEEQTGRWALDHLFVDQNAVPTFVEVKRASNTQLRREIIGQILDYAANGARWWSQDTLVQAVRKTLEADGPSYEEAMSSFLGFAAQENDEPQEERFARFWDTVQDNLQNGKVRLVLAADRLPSELVTVIEFLNKSMPSVQVVGLQLQQFRYGDSRILVPRVRGLPEEKATIASRKPAPVNPEAREFLIEIRDRITEVLGDEAARFQITQKPRKAIYFGSREASAHFKLVFGNSSDSWSPIWISFEHFGLDQGSLNRWKRTLDELARSSLPAGTEITTTEKMAFASIRVDYEDSGLADEALMLKVVNTVIAYIRAIGPFLGR